MYRQELSELARARGWDVRFYDAKAVVEQAVSRLAERGDEVLRRFRVVGAVSAQRRRAAATDDQQKRRAARKTEAVHMHDLGHSEGSEGSEP